MDEVKLVSGNFSFKSHLNEVLNSKTGGIEHRTGPFVCLPIEQLFCL